MMENKASCEPDQVQNAIYPARQKCSTAVNSGCVCCHEWKDDMKLLPCLHIACTYCIEHSPGTDTPSSPKRKAPSSLYSCPACGYKVNLTIIGGGLEILKNIPSFITDPIEGIQNGDSDDHSSFACSSCGVESELLSLFHCNECDKEVCGKCRSFFHGHHECSTSETFAQGKSEYIHSLVGDIRRKVSRHNESISCVNRVEDYLVKLKAQIESEVITRAKYLIDLIQKQKDTLLRELGQTIEDHIKQYNTTKESLYKEVKQFSFISDFSECLVENGCKTDVLKLHADVSNRCLHQLHQVPDSSIDMISLKLDIPGRGKEHSSLEKLFGSITEGKVLTGSADLVASFNVDLKWPNSIGVSNSKEVVVTGKAGAFESEGKAFFFDSRGRFYSKMDFDSKHLPLDIKPAGDGTFWLSTSDGELLNISVAGRVIRKVPDAFEGSGYITLLKDGLLAVTSSAEMRVHILSDIGERIKSITIPIHDDHAADQSKKVKLNSVTSNSDDDLIISDSARGRVIVMDIDGNLKFIYDGPEQNMNDCDSKLRCPSAICCDPFDNILIADFTNDNVHLVSKSGEFLGYVITKENGFSSPNCMALDHEGRLYMGQYGGDILVYRYMSCSKKA